MTEEKSRPIRHSKRLRISPDNGVVNSIDNPNGSKNLSSKKQQRTSLYNFDNFLESAIPEQYAIEVINDKEKQSSILSRSMRLHENEELKNVCSFGELRNQLSKKFTLNLVDYGDCSLIRRKKNCGDIRKRSETGRKKNQHLLTYTHQLDDPLPDYLFINCNTKFEKGEKKFLNIDRNKMFNEVDNSLELFSLLGMQIKRKNVKKTIEEQLGDLVVENMPLSDEQLFRLSHILGTITNLNDPLDGLEMILKYRLTVRELKSFLLTYEKVKNLEISLKKELALLETGYPPPDEETETEGNIKKLKRIRYQQRNKKIGKVTHINFYGGVTIVLDPVSKPKVIIRDKINK